MAAVSGCHGHVMFATYTSGSKLPQSAGGTARMGARRAHTKQGAAVGQQNDTPGARLKRLAQGELVELNLQLELARRGQDRALHKARKTLQRLRAIVRLLQPVDAALAMRENLRLRRLRRRLGPLRDAAARRQTFRLLASRPRWKSHVVQLRALAAAEDQRHVEAWRLHPAESPFWDSIGRECVLLARRLARWPFAAIDDGALDSALRQAEKRMQRRVHEAQGQHGRESRHELRRKLRRYANLRRAAAVARDIEDAGVKRMLALAQRCGHEGDLWMAVASARRALRAAPALRATVQALEIERRALCQRDDRLLQREGVGR